ncbi:hypothetical protein PVAND_002422 [Polypedilum vanderplanki]|uniref:Aminopeptidase N n=1 Tax=Polypedilum vanderplanki TaxID=319348 RepID=A0A9J6BRL1_POLVA|nr:hypothetical protein PVAND_002422 [Polypedilum vanderplanki]
MRDTFTIENSRHPGDYDTKKHFLNLSRLTFFLLLAMFICSLVAVALLVYNFAVCPQDDDVKVCSKHYHINENSSPSTTSIASITDIGETTEPPIIKDVRLPRSIKPLSYDIVIVPNLNGENFTFEGDVAIKIHVDESCNNITLHSWTLKIRRDFTKIFIFDIDGNVTADQIDIKNQFFIDEKQFLVLETKQELEKGKNYLLKIKYIGQITDNLQGFYKSSYTVNGETKWLVSTQFQSTDARRCFPCWDEPEFKATFKITLGRPKTMNSLSNMPLERIDTQNDRVSTPLPDYVYDIYSESVKMSTYLVAFVVSDFVNNSDSSVSVWARSDTIQSTNYALSIAPKVIKFLEDFFDIKYPLPKVDMIAIPDFQFGAMENFGLITFRETAMLYDEGVSAIGKKMTVALICAHEIAHQWFGNLVSPHWWSDLWLNEVEYFFTIKIKFGINSKFHIIGFATFMEDVIVDHIEPAWNSKDLFVVNELHQVFRLDALLSSHKVSVEVQNPDQISEIFDSISYSKGAALIRSMEYFLTTEVFRRGLSNYLKEFSYRTATQNDLWNALTKEAHRSNVLNENMSVKEIMDGWTLQTGLPYLTVTRNYENNEITLEQKRFILIEANSTEAATSNDNDDKDPLWWIPISYTTQAELDFDKTHPSQWMQATRKITIEEQLDENQWIIFNPQVAHYYRVNYDSQNWKLITDHLNDPQRYKQIANANRAQLIDDSMNLARADILDYTVAMDMTKYLKHEKDFVPWKTAINNLLYVDSMLIRTPDYNLMKKYFRSRIENIYEQLGFEDRGDILTMLSRHEILKAACHLGIPDCIANSIKEFHKWKMEANPDINNPISPNLKIVVYCTAIKHGDEEEWDFAWDRYLNTTMSSEKELLMQALGCTRQPWLLSRYLERTLENDGIRKQDTFRVFSAVSNNVWGQSIAFNFIKNNWKRIRNHFGVGSPMSTLNSLIKFVTKGMTDKNQLDDLKRFDDKELKQGRTLKQAIEQAEANILWLNKNYKKIVDWLKENSD